MKAGCRGCRSMLLRATELVEWRVVCGMQTVSMEPTARSRSRLVDPRRMAFRATLKRSLGVKTDAGTFLA